MIDFKTIVWLLPIVFMFHDFEEIVFFKNWITKNKSELKERFPKLSKRIFARFDNISTQAFTLAVAEEFVLLSIITIMSILFENYLLWLGVFMGFFIHLLIHFVQWIVFRKYIPAIYTSVISLIYCAFVLIFIFNNHIFELKDIIIWTFIGFGIVIANLLIAHKLAELFDKKRKSI